MWNMIWPIGLVILSNTVYNICTKSTPENANAFLSLGVTYFVAMLIAFAAFLLCPGRQGITTELKAINWTAFILGASVFALELGYIFIYRAGWKVSLASLTANIGLACVLIFVGVLLYKEVLSIKQIAGIIVCAAGLFLISK